MGNLIDTDKAEQVALQQADEVKADDPPDPETTVCVNGTFECISEDTIETFKFLLRPIVAKSLKEKGCIQYNLYQDRTNPCIFTIFEKWASQEDLDAHGEAPFLAPLKSDKFNEVATTTLRYSNGPVFLGRSDLSGMTIPTVDVFTYNTKEEDPLKRPNKVTTNDVFSGKKVVAFAIPGSFTPTCQEKQAPTFVEKFDEFAKMGIDAVYCLAKNDPFVVNAFINKIGGKDKIRVLADVDGLLCEALGSKLFDLAVVGCGSRPLRFSFYAEDGVIQQYFEEPDPIQMTVTGAETMIKAINVQASFQ